ncbi:MAG: Hsp20/alpha crystallin family protein [Candidatus Micrarchaeales archaeon]
MGKKKNSGQKKANGFLEVNKLIAQFLEEVAKDFSEHSGSIKSSEPITYRFNIELSPTPQQEQLKFSRSPSEDARDILVDTIEREKEIAVIAELPGVERREITIIASHNEVSIENKSKPKLNRKIRLKGTVDPDSGIAKFRNGILEITFSKSSYSNKSVNLKIKD